MGALKMKRKKWNKLDKRTLYSPVIFKHGCSLETYLVHWRKKVKLGHLYFSRNLSFLSKLSNLGWQSTFSIFEDLPSSSLHCSHKKSFILSWFLGTQYLFPPCVFQIFFRITSFEQLDYNVFCIVFFHSFFWCL